MNRKFIRKTIKEDINRSTWSKWMVKNVYHIEYFFNGKFVDKRTLNSLFESEGFDTDVDTVEDEIEKAVRSVKLGNLDGNALHIAHNSIGNRIDVVFGVSNFIGNVKSFYRDNDEGVVEIYGYIEEQGEGEYLFGFKIEVICDIDRGDFDLAESKNLKKSTKPYIKLMVNRIVDELIGEYSSKEWDALPANEKLDVIKAEYFMFDGESKYLSEVRDLVIENMNHPFNIVFESKKPVRKSLKESTDESFSLYDLNKHDPFIKEWVKNINKELKDVSIESIGDDEIVFRVWFDETMNLDIFDDIVTDCMPKTLIEFISDMNIDFDYQFVYADDKFIENDYVFIRFVAW